MITYDCSSATEQTPYQPWYLHEPIADHLNVQAKRIDIRDDHSNYRKRQNGLNKFTESSHPRAVSNKDLTCQSAYTPGFVRSLKRWILDRRHQSNAQKFNEELRPEESVEGIKEHFPRLCVAAHVHCVVGGDRRPGDLEPDDGCAEAED